MTGNSTFVTLRGERFHLHSWGEPDKPTLLCLHGFPEYGGAWGDLAPHLIDDFHVLAPDQRGYGQSWAPSDVGAYVLSELVADMAALIGSNGPVRMLGHDWGAAVAYGLAMFRPDLVSHLVIANGVHPVPFQRALCAGGAQAAASQYILTLRAEGSETRLAENDFARLLRLFSAKMDLSWLQGPRLADYKREWARPGRLRGMINWYRASPLIVPDPVRPIPMPELPLDRLRVTCPHLLIWGANDSALLPEATEGLEAFAPDLTRETLQDCDHWLCHQRPEEVAKLIRSFCR